MTMQTCSHDNDLLVINLPFNHSLSSACLYERVCSHEVTGGVPKASTSSSKNSSSSSDSLISEKDTTFLAA